MTEEKKEGCCSPTPGSKCCSGKKLIFGFLVGSLIFFAGMLFAKYSCGGQKMCLLPGSVAQP